ncbi:MAG: translation initiation factor IF-6 [Candidatus Thermoplasmatota archaeon]|nr:translation initiation factor IF-6 [Candidatus Thermoplasmatota archaeon]
MKPRMVTMSISTGDILGHSLVGIHLAPIGDVLFAPYGVPQEELDPIAEAYGLEPVKISIGGSSLVGSLLAGTKKGIAVADIASKDDIDMLLSYTEAVVVMESGVNAAGNLICATEKGAIVSQSVPEEGVSAISEILQVPAQRTTVAGMHNVGSQLVANSNGALVHPDVTSEEVEIIESILGVKAMVGTVCFGSPEVGSGCVANDSFALVGDGTTGPELNRIEDALGLI